MFGVKKKLKLSLVDDFIKVYECKLFLETDDTKKETIELANEMLCLYEKLFFKFNMINESYILLKQNLKNKTINNNSKNININEILLNIIKNLNIKLIKLKLNKFETNYLFIKVCKYLN